MIAFHFHCYNKREQIIKISNYCFDSLMFRLREKLVFLLFNSSVILNNFQTSLVFPHFVSPETFTIKSQIVHHIGSIARSMSSNPHLPTLYQLVEGVDLLRDVTGRRPFFKPNSKLFFILTNSLLKRSAQVMQNLPFETLTDWIWRFMEVVYAFLKSLLDNYLPQNFLVQQHVEVSIL